MRGNGWEDIGVAANSTIYTRQEARQRCTASHCRRQQVNGASRACDDICSVRENVTACPELWEWLSRGAAWAHMTSRHHSRFTGRDHGASGLKVAAPLSMRAANVLRAQPHTTMPLIHESYDSLPCTSTSFTLPALLNPSKCARAAKPRANNNSQPQANPPQTWTHNSTPPVSHPHAP